MKPNQHIPLFALTAFLTFSSPAALAVEVLIDAGHGGRDPGATYKEVKEADITLAFASNLQSALKKKGYITHLRRANDKHWVTSVESRKKLNWPEPDVVVSLHAASSKDPKARGIRIFLSPKKGDDELLYEDRELPKRIADALRTIEPKRKVTIHRSGAPILGSDKAILIELGYLSNEKDREHLLNPDYQREVAKTLSNTINDLF